MSVAGGVQTQSVTTLGPASAAAMRMTSASRRKGARTLVMPLRSRSRCFERGSEPRGYPDRGRTAQIPWENFVRMTLKWKVALVEDDRRLARAVATGLGEEGYTVRAVESAGRGLGLSGQWNPVYVLLDLVLPSNEGTYSCRASAAG